MFVREGGKVYAEGAVKDVLTEENLKAVYDINFEVHKMKNNDSIFFMPVI